MTDPPSHEPFEALLMKTVDGVATADERARLAAHLEACEAAAPSLDDFLRIKRATDAMSQRLRRDAHIEPPRPDPAVRAWMGVAFASMLAGALALVGFALYVLFTDVTVPPVVRFGMGALALGGAFVLGRLLVLRLRARGRDPYQEIDR